MKSITCGPLVSVWWWLCLQSPRHPVFCSFDLFWCTGTFVGREKTCSLQPMKELSEGQWGSDGGHPTQSGQVGCVLVGSGWGRGASTAGSERRGSVWALGHHEKNMFRYLLVTFVRFGPAMSSSNTHIHWEKKCKWASFSKIVHLKSTDDRDRVYATGGQQVVCSWSSLIRIFLVCNRKSKMWKHWWMSQILANHLRSRPNLEQTFGVCF